MELPQAFKDLTLAFSRLPGVGQKTAMRYMLSIMKWNEQERDRLAHALQGLAEVQHCKSCGVFSDEEICEICNSDDRKKQRTICVVENISDLIAIERGGFFRGQYHVVGGVLNPLVGVGPDQLNIASLEKRVGDGQVDDIILAINPSVEGDATCAYIADLLQNKCRVERIGFGMPIGGSLEFLDPMTISKAIENRQLL